MDHIPPAGFVRNQRVVLNHLDVSTQANFHQSDHLDQSDSPMSRFCAKEKRDTAHYDRQDIREQYCITDRGLGALEANRPHAASLFGCLSTRGSPCSNRPSLLTACVRQKAPSDENLHELGKRRSAEYAPYPRKNRYPWGPVITDIYHYDEDLQSSYFRRKVGTDPSRYTWMPADDESVRMEKPTFLMDSDHSYEHLLNTQPALLAGKKHVSFARSHTLASFDDARSTLSSSTSQLNTLTKSQERLLDMRKMELQPITKQPEHDISSDKIRKTPMKTQATQTEINLGRRTPPSHINLSPRTMQKVKMVSQGAQTNGQNGRKLIKSYSEAGDTFGAPFLNGDTACNAIFDHEPLHRTQSDEPPRSPFVLDSSPCPSPPKKVESEASLSIRSDQDSEDSAEVKNEIFIDFKPQLTKEATTVVKRSLIKALSDGEILLEQRRATIGDDRVVPDKPTYSHSHENVHPEENPKTFSPYFQKSPILNEGICKPLEDNIYSSRDTGLYGQDSIDEDFHEHLIYNRRYLNTQHSVEGGSIGMETWLRDECVVPSISFTSEKRLSPFTSNDSLANDARDQSDGIWNESQVTVLQADSGTDNGTALSGSEMTSATSPGSATLSLTPSSRRKHLLMLQHQQRSSFDTEALLDEEVGDQASSHLKVSEPDQQPEVSRQYLSVQKVVPLRRRSQQEPPAETQPAVVPDLLLARTDSCRTNTDLSESTTTDDYVTANSGTDSSRISVSSKGMEMYNNVQQHQLLPNEGSSFESSRSVDQLLTDDMVVPSDPRSLCSTPSPRHPRSLCNTPVPLVHTGRSTPSEDTSSSCGSYSVGGIGSGGAGTPDLLERATPTPSKRGERARPGSDDDRSVRYSSSGYYESPVEDDSTWTSPRYENKKPSDPKSYLEVNSVPNSKPSKRNIKLSPSSEKPKRTRSRIRSPMQNNKKSHQLKKSSVVYLNDKENKATSDESSCDIGMKHLANPNSPWKNKKSRDRENEKRRSPVNADKKPSGVSGSLGKRKTTRIPNTGPSPDNSLNKKLSNGETPESNRHCPKENEDTCKLKALSAESLRSVSPGSDSVFYSDPSSLTADHHIHCLHCGKEVDIVTTDDPDKPATCGEIFQPPAGFQDSPRIKPPERLFKKFDRRLRSEDRNLTENKQNRHGTEVRAKSEERATKSYRNKLRPMAKSTNNSQEQLKATDSSPSILPGEPENEDDTGIYDVPYIDGCWIHIDEREEVNSCKTSCSSPNDLARTDSVSSTESEKEFRKRYQAVTHRMVHRKSCLEMYKRQNNKSFGPMSKWNSKEKHDPYYICIHED
ncbi:unnamed protein product [Phaedon cochleariae]|uniref:Uncharacterized protein n=1 Tax=Phaedon cochleariae TaxID=80249 RepID=A0A9P0DV47_PHACE|nr:unnamed protein product [Phaedon cochleariae]